MLLYTIDDDGDDDDGNSKKGVVYENVFEHFTIYQKKGIYKRIYEMLWVLLLLLHFFF